MIKVGDLFVFNDNQDKYFLCLEAERYSFLCKEPATEPRRDEAVHIRCLALATLTRHVFVPQIDQYNQWILIKAES